MLGGQLVAERMPHPGDPFLPVLSVLKAGLGHKEWLVRYYCVELLGVICKDRDEREAALRLLLDDKQEDVREAVRKALRR